MNCFWADNHPANVDIQVLLAREGWDIWNYSTFHSEFGGQFVFQVQLLSGRVKTVIRFSAHLWYW